MITVLHTFTGNPTDGSGPVGSLVPFGSNVYGMTNTGGIFGDGSVYMIGINGGGYTILHSFGSSILTGGINPFGTLAQAGGVFYGMTAGGGSAATAGTVSRSIPTAAASQYCTLLRAGLPTAITRSALPSSPDRCSTALPARAEPPTWARSTRSTPTAAASP